jgi:hypothetical protein
VCRILGIAEQTFYRRRREYGGLKVDQARRLKALEQENARLKRAVADLTLDRLILGKQSSSKPCPTPCLCGAGLGSSPGIGAPGLPGDRSLPGDPAVSSEGSG